MHPKLLIAAIPILLIAAFNIVIGVIALKDLTTDKDQSHCTGTTPASPASRARAVGKTPSNSTKGDACLTYDNGKCYRGRLDKDGKCVKMGMLPAISLIVTGVILFALSIFLFVE